MSPRAIGLAVGLAVVVAAVLLAAPRAASAALDPSNGAPAPWLLAPPPDATCAAAHEREAGFFQHLRDSARDVCTTQAESGTAPATVIEHTAPFAGSTVSVVRYSRIRVAPTIFDSPEYVACTGPNRTYLIDARGRETTPRWLMVAAAPVDDAEVVGAGQTQPQRPARRTSPPGPRTDVVEASLLIRVERRAPGHALANLEAAFHLFLALELLRPPEWFLVFKDKAEQHFGDDSVFRAILKEPDRDLRFHKPTAEVANTVVEILQAVEFSGFPLTAVTTTTTAAAATTANASSLSLSSSSWSACPSRTFQAFTHWFVKSANVPERGARGATDVRLRVLWSSRQPYKAVSRTKSVVLPSRRLEDETQFLLDLADELGSGVELRTIDFAAKGAVDCINAARDVDVVVGVHGAGLAWSMFLPSPGRAALVELLTVDVAEEIAAISPYRRISQLNGNAHVAVRIAGTYREPPFPLPFGGEQREIRWLDSDVTAVANAIKALPLNRPLTPTDKFCK